MGRTKYRLLLDKSVQAAISSIEVYNKPDFKYREETFSILLVNAWELLLKARIIMHHRTINCIYEYEIRDKSKPNRRSLVKTRSGNPKTLSLYKCLEKCMEIPQITLESACRDNIDLLIQIRDSSIHFQSFDKRLSIKVYEIGIASLKNYVNLVKEWFDYDLSRYNFYLMPLSFFHEFESIESFSVNSKDKQVETLLKYIEQSEQAGIINDGGDYRTTLKLSTIIVKGQNENSIPFHFARNSEAQEAKAIVNITNSDAEFVSRYPHDYNTLYKKLQKRYSNFRKNRAFDEVLKKLKNEAKYAGHRPNNVKNPEGSKTTYYSGEVFNVFDNIYTKKQ